MKRLVAAVTFLTRMPVPGEWNIDARDVGRSAAFFPLIGAAIGALEYGLVAAAVLLSHWVGRHSGRAPFVPVPVLAVVIISVGVLATGGLHLDGLADAADGLGGGRSRDDVLRIMRDHAIGAYGGMALILVLALKIGSACVLIEHGAASRFLVLAPALARASVVVLGFFAPYARETEGGLGQLAQHIGALEIVVSSATAVALAVWLSGWQGGAALGVTAMASLVIAVLCMRKIGGVTGDTLGANVEICEALVLATGAVLSS